MDLMSGMRQNYVKVSKVREIACLLNGFSLAVIGDDNLDSLEEA